MMNYVERITLIVKLNLKLQCYGQVCDCSDTWILVSGTITVAEVATRGGNNCIQEVFKNCDPFTNCSSEVNNTEIDNARYVDRVMPMYNYLKTSGGLWQYYRDKPALAADCTSANFPGNSASIKSKEKTTSSTRDDGTKNVEDMVSLKYLSKF